MTDEQPLSPVEVKTDSSQIAPQGQDKLRKPDAK
jgi:hypothetical protein